MRLIAMFLLLVFFVGASAAQGRSPFPIVERCITSPTEPPDDWTFEGTIITFRQGDGVHGFRADTPSRYYIAFADRTELILFGALAPNEQWFAIFKGRMEYTSSSLFNKNFYIENIQVISTLPSRETFDIPFESYQYTQRAHFRSIIWLNNSQLAAYKETGSGIGEGWFVVNPFRGTIEQATTDETLEIEIANPKTTDKIVLDSTLPYVPVTDSNAPVFINPSKIKQTTTLHITDLIIQQTYDTCIETSLAFALSPTDEQVAVSIGGEDGFVYIIDIAEWKAYRLDLAANSVIAWVGDEE